MLQYGYNKVERGSAGKGNKMPTLECLVLTSGWGRW